MNNHEGSVRFPGIGIRHIDGLNEVQRTSLSENNTICVWTAYYADLGEHYLTFFDMLSETEQEIASTFRKAADARRYILRHGMVRSILGTVTHSEPGKVPLITGKNGKPELDFHKEFQKICFNLSHTTEMIGIGVIKNFEIGIDIVKINPRCPIQEIAEYLFTPHEIKYLQGIKSERRKKIFFSMWAIKEAIIKVSGEGLHRIQDTDVMNIVQNPFSEPYRYTTSDTLYKDFLIYPFIPDEGCRGAVAVRMSGANGDYGNFLQGQKDRDA